MYRRLIQKVLENFKNYITELHREIQRNTELHKENLKNTRGPDSFQDVVNKNKNEL